MFIISTQNKIIKHAASLKNKKYREEHKEFLAEGLRSVIDLISIDPKCIQSIFVSQKQSDRFLTELKKLNLKGNYINERLMELSDPLMKKISDTSTPQQILAVVKQKQESEITDYCVYLDRIRDPGNLGTIIRTAAAAGYSLILDNCADVFSPKVVRSSMSAIMTVDFCYANKDTFAMLKREDYTVLAADTAGKSMYNFESLNKVCIVVGNEANGIAADIFKKCDGSVSIPVQKVESLNAAVSAAIIMYHFKYSI